MFDRFEQALPPREQREAHAQADAFVQAIDITLGAHGLTGPTTPYTAPWLDGCARLPLYAERIARGRLADPDRILGEAPRSASTRTTTTAVTTRRRRPAGGGDPPARLAHKRLDRRTSGPRSGGSWRGVAEFPRPKR